MKELSTRDLELVSGAVGPIGAVIGAATGAATYVGYSIATGQGSLSGLFGSTATSAGVGFVSGPTGLSAMQAGALTIGGTQLGFYGGMLGGYVQSGIDAAGTNYGDAAGVNYQ